VRSRVGTVERHLELSRHAPTLAHTTDNDHRALTLVPAVMALDSCPAVPERVVRR